MTPPLPVLYRDERYVAVDKPAGLLVHRSPLTGRGETEFALQRVRDQIGQRVYPVHRLDRPTSGVLVFGLDPEAARALVERFTAREVSKRYFAVVRGWAPEGPTRVEHPLRELDDFAPRTRPATAPVVREACTTITALAQARVPVPVGRYPERRYSLVLAEPHTGRRHQIRRHLKHINHPIIGDVRHGKGEHNRFFRERYGVARMLLVARQLRFQHPFTGASVTIDAPAAEAMVAVGRALGWTSQLAVSLDRP